MQSLKPKNDILDIPQEGGFALPDSRNIVFESEDSLLEYLADILVGAYLESKKYESNKRRQKHE